MEYDFSGNPQFWIYVYSIHLAGDSDTEGLLPESLKKDFAPNTKITIK